MSIGIVAPGKRVEALRFLAHFILAASFLHAGQAAFAEAGEAGLSALGAVIVTAQKRPQPAQDVPISMAVLGEEALEKSRARSLDELQHLVPGFSMETQSGYNVLTLRGVGGGGRNIGFDPRAGVYLDGIYMSQAQALRQPLFDVERVEVLRGPQGHLFGRNTVAGAVNITTRGPSRGFEVFAGGGLGNRGAQEGHATISGPLSDNVLGRLSVATETREGFTKNLYDGRRLDDLNRSSIRGQIAILPLPTDRLKISLSADASKNDRKLILGEPVSDFFGAPLPGGPLPKRKVNFDRTPKESAELSGASATASYTMDGGHVLTAILGRRDTRHLKQVDIDYSPRDILWTHYVDRFEQASGEIRIASPQAGRTRYVAGFYHLGETARTDRVVTIGQDSAPVLFPWGPLPGALITNDGRVRTDSTALFGTLDHDITERLTLNLGARYTHEAKRVLFNLDGSASAGFGIGTLSGYRDSRSESKLSPTVGATWAVSADQNAYAKYSRGFKSGGWNTEYLSTNAARNPSFDTETVDSVELGTKGRLLGGRLRYDLAVYASRFKDFQVFQFVDLGGGATSIELRNAAEAESRGLDAGLSFRATRQLDLGLNLGWNRATFKKFDTCSPVVDCTGNRLPYAPAFTSALTANYGLPMADAGGRLDIYGEISHHGKSFADPVNDPATQRVPSRNLVNLRIGYLPNNSRWSFNLWARNLLDRDTVAMRFRDFLGNQIVRRMDPRTVGIEARFDL